MENLHPAYAAGLFDGEGWFSIRKMSGAKTGCTREFQFNVTISMTMRESLLVEMFQKKYGGTVRLQKSYSGKHSPYYKWHGSRGVTENFLNDTQEFLIAKKKQAEVCREFIDMKKDSGFRAISDEKYQKYVSIYEYMRELNQKGVGK